MLEFLAAARLDWAGFFSFSREDGTAAATMDGEVPRSARPRAPARVRRGAGPDHRRAARLALVGETVDVLVDGIDDDGVLVGRTYREAPEIDGVVRLVGNDDAALFARPGAIVTATVTGIAGPDLEATPVASASTRGRS